MASVKRPKMKRYPRRPKASASLEAWKRYDAKCKEVEKENSARMAKYHKDKKELETIKKHKLHLMTKTKGLTGIAHPKRRTK